MKKVIVEFNKEKKRIIILCSDNIFYKSLEDSMKKLFEKTPMLKKITKIIEK